MSSKVKIQTVAQIDDSWLASSASHLNFNSVIAGDFEGDLSQYRAGIAFREPF